MELTQEEKDIVVKILSRADGEDMDEIVKLTGFYEYLTHSLIMSNSDYDLNYQLEERKYINQTK